MAPRSSRLRWASVARVGLVGLVLGGGAAGLVAAARSADRRVDRGRDAARVEEAAAAGQGVATFLDAALAQAGGLAGAVRALPGSAQSVAQSAALSGALAGANLLDGGGFLVDPAGTVVAAPAAQADLYRRQETWPELAQSVTAPTVSGLHADGIEHRVDVLFAAPASAGTVAVGRAPMPGGALAAALGRIREPSATQVVVIDAHNEVVSGPAPSSPGVDAPSGLAPAIQDGRTRPPGLTAARAEGGADRKSVV